MGELGKTIAVFVSSSSRDCVSGAGMAFDPCPRSYKKTFRRSDLEAFISDYKALLLDWYHVATKAAHELEEHRPEVSHHWKPGSGKRAESRNHEPV